MQDKSLVVAAMQMNSSDNVLENIATAEQQARQAVLEGASLLVYPENFLCFGSSGAAALNSQLDEVLERLGDLARELRVGLIAGSLPFSSSNDPDRFHTTCVAFDSTGKQLARYNKMHLFDVDVGDNIGSYRESDTYVAGDKPVVVELEGMRIGLSICYDLRFPVLYQYYMEQGVDAVIVPAAFTYKTGKAHWSTLIRARAIETQCYVIAPNQCGLHSGGRETWGHSMIVNPWGDVLAECGGAPGFCNAELDLSKLQEVRKNMPIAAHKRLVQ